MFNKAGIPERKYKFHILIKKYKKVRPVIHQGRPWRELSKQGRLYEAVPDI